MMELFTYHMNNLERLAEHIESISIPDSDVLGWMQTLRESGLSQEEIDRFLARLNAAYREGLDPMSPQVEQELTEIIRYIEQEHGRTVTPELREYLRAGIEQRLRGQE